MKLFIDDGKAVYNNYSPTNVIIDFSNLFDIVWSFFLNLLLVYYLSISSEPLICVNTCIIRNPNLGNYFP